jgi:pyrroline-5-carboxylate reductase
MFEYDVALIGAGNMASEIGRRLILYGGIPPNRIIATHHDEANARSFEEVSGIKVTLDNTEAAAKSRQLVLCVRPQQALIALSEIKPFFSSDHIIISVALGTSTNLLSHYLETDRVIRLHPTSLVFVSKEWNPGASVWVAHPDLPKDLNSELLDLYRSAIGEMWVVDEEALPLSILIVGNSPAYFAKIADMFIQVISGYSASQLPLPASDAYKAILKSIYTGIVEEGKDPSLIVKQIATKAGVTQKGIDLLQEKAAPVVGELFEITLNRIREIDRDLEERFASD